MINFSNRHLKKAQQLVEFLFAAPILIIFLGILTEYAYALNINMTLSETLKTATSTIYKEIKPNNTADDIRTIVTTNFKKALSDNNVPLNAENNLKVGYATSGETAVFTAEYTYVPAFTLPNTYFKFMPDKFDFFATSAIPLDFLTSNGYDTSINSNTLDGIWTNTSSLTSQSDFNNSKNGIMKNTDGRNNVLFMLYSANSSAIINALNSTTNANAYALIGWDGSAKQSGTKTYYTNVNDGSIYLCDMMTCTNNGNKFLSYLNSNDYYNVIFVDSSAATFDSYSNNKWAYHNLGVNADSNSNLTATDISGILKNSLALIDTNSLSIGNYDNIAVSGYNGGVSTGNTYRAAPFGSLVFICPATVSLSNLESGFSPSEFNKNYSFN